MTTCRPICKRWFLGGVAGGPGCAEYLADTGRCDRCSDLLRLFSLRHLSARRSRHAERVEGGFAAVTHQVSLCRKPNGALHQVFQIIRFLECDYLRVTLSLWFTGGAGGLLLSSLQQNPCYLRKYREFRRVSGRKKLDTFGSRLRCLRSSGLSVNALTL